MGSSAEGDHIVHGTGAVIDVEVTVASEKTS
jgi:hypothetical protein